MYYLYRTTHDTSEPIAKFTDSETASLYMEHLALRDNDPQVIGYAVRDYDLKTIVEYEK